MSSVRQKAIRTLKNMSNERLERLLRKHGHNIGVNFLTRGTVESKIIAKLRNYTDEEIERFLGTI